MSLKEILAVMVVMISLANSSLNEVAMNDPEYGTSWMYFPDDEGNLQAINLDEGDGDRASLAHPNPDSKISLWLYTKQNKDKPILLKATGAYNLEDFTLDDSYDGYKKTKILIHGWKSKLSSAAVQVIKDAYLKEPEDMNVIIVDWGKMATDTNYMRAAASTRNVGRNIAMVIDRMVTHHRAYLKDIHIIGHSLGAHTAGFAGMYLIQEKGKQVGRITGLDPAFPGFTDAELIDERLDTTDADFVDIIHTCSGLLGHLNNLGHVDFYPNGGKTIQPGCVAIDLFGACSHARSYRFFAESVHSKNAFMSVKCKSWADYTANICDDDTVPMGDACPSSTRGIYFLETSEGPTFGLFWKRFRSNDDIE